MSLLFLQVEHDQLDEGNGVHKGIQYSGNIVLANRFSVILDGVVIASCGSINESLAVLIVGLFVFNIAYPRDCRNFLPFVTAYFLRLKDDNSHTTKSRTLMVKLGELDLLNNNTTV